MVDHVIYDSFGRIVSESNAAEGSLFGFTGRPVDRVTALQNNLNRWYDAEVGRWMSKDPIGFEGEDGNTYRYVGNGATSTTDPNGLSRFMAPAIHQQIVREAAKLAKLDEYYRADVLIREVRLGNSWGRYIGKEYDLFVEGLEAGSESIDAPEGRPAFFANFIREKLDAADKDSLTARSFGGDLQWWHCMAPPQAKGRTMTAQELIGNLAFKTVKLYEVALQAKKKDSEIEVGLQAKEDLDFSSINAHKAALNQAAVALGTISHIIADSYCPPHVQRENWDKAPGAIVLIQDYDEQDSNTHTAKEDPRTDARAEKGRDTAVTMFVKVLEMFKEGKDVSSFEAWLKGPDGPFVIAPNAKVGGAYWQYVGKKREPPASIDWVPAGVTIRP